MNHGDPGSLLRVAQRLQLVTHGVAHLDGCRVAELYGELAPEGGDGARELCGPVRFSGDARLLGGIRGQVEGGQELALFEACRVGRGDQLAVAVRRGEVGLGALGVVREDQAVVIECQAVAPVSSPT